MDANAGTTPSGAGDLLGGIGGAAAGSFLGGPAGTALLGAASNVLGAALAPSPAGPAISSTSTYTNTDHSGFNVSTGQGNTSSAGAFPWYVWVAAAVGLYWYLEKRHK